MLKKFTQAMCLAVLLTIAASACTTSPGGAPSTTTPTIPVTTPTIPTTHAPFSRPLVSVEFDDGWASAYKLGLPLANEFGFPTTQYIITDTAKNNASYGVGTYMTPAMITDWLAKGGDIGCHTQTHADLTTLTAAQAQVEMAGCKSYLGGFGKTPTLFATPYCASDKTVTDLAKQLFQDMRNCDSPTNTADDFDRWNVHSISIENTTTVADVKAILADAKATNGWTVLTFHEVGTPIDPADPTYTTSVAQLRAIFQAIKDSGIAVVSTQAGLNESIG